MEKINKHNYEAWLLDFIEGNLSPEQQHDLFVFLAAHPELKARFEGDFGDVVLVPGDVSFDKKEQLKVAEDDVLSPATVETWMIGSVEGLLSKSRRRELETYVQKHGLEQTYKAYQSTRLKPDLALAFENKRSLKVATGLVIPLYARIAAAAAVVILLVTVAVGYLPGKEPVPAASSRYAGVSPFVSSGVPAESVIDQQPSQPNLANALPDPDESVSGTPSHRIVGVRPDNRIEQRQWVPKDSVSVPLKEVPGPVNEVAVVPQDSIPGADEVIGDEDLASAPASLIRSEQPYKLITDAASNVTNREIFFSRDKDLASNEYVAYQLRIGNFEFERKKSRP